VEGRGCEELIWRRKKITGAVEGRITEREESKNSLQRIAQEKHFPRGAWVAQPLGVCLRLGS